MQFSQMLTSLNAVLALKDLPIEKMTAKTATLVNIFESEKTRYEKITKPVNP